MKLPDCRYPSILGFFSKKNSMLEDGVNFKFNALNINQLDYSPPLFTPGNFFAGFKKKLTKFRVIGSFHDRDIQGRLLGACVTCFTIYVMF
jgi:hypothetical protein